MYISNLIEGYQRANEIYQQIFPPITVTAKFAYNGSVQNFPSPTHKKISFCTALSRRLQRSPCQCKTLSRQSLNIWQHRRQQCTVLSLQKSPLAKIPPPYPGPTPWRPSLHCTLTPVQLANFFRIFFLSYKRKGKFNQYLTAANVIKGPYKTPIHIYANYRDSAGASFSPFVKADGGMLFSYQNLSPFLSIWNCWPRRHPKVGPTTAPDSGLSARPPTCRSMSVTWSYTWGDRVSLWCWYTQTCRALFFLAVRFRSFERYFRVICSLKWALYFQNLADRSALWFTLFWVLFFSLGLNGPVRY